MKRRSAGILAAVIFSGCILGVYAEERITDERVVYGVVQGAYNVSFEYPVLTEMDGFSQEILDKVNQYFKEAAENRCEAEALSYQETAEWFMEVEQEDLVETLTYEATCESVYILNHAYSVMQQHYTYTGGAHPYTWKEGYTYDMNTGELMSMGEILGCDEETAVEAVILAYQENIIGQVEYITEESIRDAFPEMEYWFDEEGLRVSIAPYIVASYAAGPQDVLVTQDHVAAVRAW